jgi:pyroglutamyl-peptidase
LPLRAIRSALLTQGIPAHISNSAGAYLCNAALFTLLSLSEARPKAPMAGFIHLPYLPEQVALLLQEPERERGPAGPPPSMALATMTAAVRTAIETTLD